jgi:DUF1365 family protein
MDIIPQIFTARVIHKRLFPKENSFSYGLYYLLLPLPVQTIPSKLVSFNRRDLGYRDGSDPENFAKTILQTYGLEQKINHIMLVTMPSVLGYVFNPVSFYLCLDQEKQLRAVISEVHNTFGQQHTYLCAHSDHSSIKNDDWLEAEKLFHVSPFLERKGIYKFRFSLQKNEIGIWIDYFDEEKNKQLLTSLIGCLQPLNRSSINKVFLSYPLLTLKTIILIHWQALKLIVKNIRYISKPKQYEDKVSTTSDLKKAKDRNINF